METVLVLMLNLMLYVQTTDANCSFPDDLRGVFISTYNGPMVFTDSYISGYRTDVPLAPIMELECLQRNETFFTLKSTTSIIIFGLETHLYLCLEIEKLSNTIFQYYIRTEYDSYLSGYMYGHNDPAADKGDVCVNSDREPFLLVRNISVTSNMTIGQPCPVIIQGHHNLVPADDSTDKTCTNGFLESCSKSEHFQLDVNNECANNFGNTTFTCLHYSTRYKTYIYTWTDNEELYSISPYGFFCIEISGTDKDLSLAMFSDNCSNDTDEEAVFKIQLYDTSGLCPNKGESIVKVLNQQKDPPTSPALVAVIVVIVCISLVLVVIFVLHRQRNRFDLQCLRKKETNDNRFNDIR